MARDPQIELRVSRLENDTNAIYGLLAEIRSTQHEHSLRFESVDHRFESVEHHLESVDRRFDAVDQRFDAVDQRFDAVDRRFDSIDATLAEVVRRLPEPS